MDLWGKRKKSYYTLRRRVAGENPLGEESEVSRFLKSEPLRTEKHQGGHLTERRPGMMKLSLRVITPSVFGAGENASAIADYIYDPQKRAIYLIDQVKFNRWLMEQGKCPVFNQDITY